MQDTSVETFSIFLHYLYTDQADINLSNAMDVLVLADAYCMKRLVNICECYIKERIEKSVMEDKTEPEIDVVRTLLKSQVRLHCLS